MNCQSWWYVAQTQADVYFLWLSMVWDGHPTKIFQPAVDGIPMNSTNSVLLDLGFVVLHVVVLMLTNTCLT
jgi:hypothetical protein